MVGFFRYLKLHKWETGWTVGGRSAFGISKSPWHISKRSYTVAKSLLSL